jgi:hypothetical protein
MAIPVEVVDEFRELSDQLWFACTKMPIWARSKTEARTLSHCTKGRRQRLPENPKRPNA